jgi:hypothetical protein
VNSPDNKKRGARFSVFIASLAFFAVASIILLSEEGRSKPVDCEIDRGPCAKAFGKTGAVAIFEIVPRPVETMKNLLFRVELKGGQIPVTDGDMVVSLSMPGMYMSENRIKLTHVGEDKYEGEGVIVRCPSGRNLWRAEVIMRRPAPHSDMQETSFVFRVDKS